jgi:hypothetical protein
MGYFGDYFGLAATGGTATYAAAGDVEAGVDRGDGVLGTLVVPVVGDVRSGTGYGALGTEHTGTLNVSGTAGSGADTVTLRILIGGATAVENAEVWVTTDAEGQDVFAGTLLTNASGEVVFLLDAGTTYYLWCDGGGANPIQGQAFQAESD